MKLSYRKETVWLPYIILSSGSYAKAIYSSLRYCNENAFTFISTTLYYFLRPQT